MESRTTGDESVAKAVVEVADATATLRERIRLQLATPLYRFRLALVIATVLAPGVLAAVAHLPVGPTAAVGLAVLVTCSIPYLDPTIRATTSFRLFDDGGIELARTGQRRIGNLAAIRDHVTVGGVGTMLRAGNLVVIVPERTTTAAQRSELATWIRRGEEVRDAGGQARWGVMRWGSPTTTLPHRPSSRPALRAGFLLLLALGLAAYAYVATWRSVNDELIASIALAAAVPLAVGLGLVVAELVRQRGTPTTQSCEILDDRFRVATHTDATEMTGDQLMSVTRTSGGIDVRYRSGLLCLPRAAFRDHAHRDQFATALRELRDRSR